MGSELVSNSRLARFFSAEVSPGKLILMSMAIGALLGGTSPVWTQGVQTAQMLAGLISYPPTNNSYFTQTGVYSFFGRWGMFTLR